MTLKTLLDKISNLAIKQDLVHWTAAGSSIYDLNNRTINTYPILFTSPTGNHMVAQDTTTFTLTLYFIDRLIEDNANDLDIYSTAVEELKNLINGIKLLDGVLEVSDEYQITNFIDTEALSDRCAGAYCEIQISTVNASTCFE